MKSIGILSTLVMFVVSLTFRIVISHDPFSLRDVCKRIFKSMGFVLGFRDLSYFNFLKRTVYMVFLDMIDKFSCHIGYDIPYIDFSQVADNSSTKLLGFHGQADSVAARGIV